MSKKTLKIIMSFHSTSEALKMEKICRKNNIRGRLIPIPREVSAGCGMAWSSEIELKEEILKVVEENSISIGNIYEMMK